MPLLLLTSDRDPHRIASLDDDVARTQPGPAAIISAPETGPHRGRPVAFREAGGDWQEVGFEAADHWVQMTDELRSRLVADHLAPLDVAEFKLATNGGSASIITNNWVHSGHPRIYRIAGQMRDFVTVLAQLDDA